VPLVSDLSWGNAFIEKETIINDLRMMEPYLKNKPQKYLKLFFYYKEKCEQFRMLEELGQNSCDTFSVPGKSITSNPTRLYKLKLMKIEELKL
jgi:hypothetical protein